MSLWNDYCTLKHWCVRLWCVMPHNCIICSLVSCEVQVICEWRRR